MNVRTLALTGGIGSGKSTVARTMVACGAYLVDTDAIARSLTLPGGVAMPALQAEFGAQALMPNGALDREYMRQLVFSNPADKARLEGMLHPLIGNEALRQAALAGDRPVVFDVPLLGAASHWRQRAQRVLVLDCSEDMQVERVAQRPGWTAEAARGVIAQQATRATRRATADAVIFNERLSLDALAAEVHSLWAFWVGVT